MIALQVDAPQVRAVGVDALVTGYGAIRIHRLLVETSLLAAGQDPVAIALWQRAVRLIILVNIFPILIGLVIERQSLGLLEKVLAQSPRGDELRSRALGAALENLPPLDYAGQLLLDGVALAPRSSAWLYSSSAHDPWPSRVLALPALTRALILTEIEEGLDTLNSSEPPRGRLGWGLFPSQPDVPWRMQRKCEEQMALRSRVMAALTANMGPRHESDSISRPDR